MKTVLMIVMALTVAAVYGCTSPRGGAMASDEGFKIAAPTFTTDILQGDTKTVTVSVTRDKYFKQDVTLQLTTTTGISVSPSKVVVKASASPDVAFQIKAAKDAALGEYRVQVTATPKTGNPTAMDFAVKVVAP